MKLINKIINKNITKEMNLFLLCDVDDELIDSLSKLDIRINLYYFVDVDWMSDFSIWPYDRFKGNGNNTISLIKETGLNDLFICGYSLGGLLSLYAINKIDNLKGIGSVSGSLWYPDFDKYIKTINIKGYDIYISLGDKEAKCKNKIMKTVEDKTNDIVNYLKIDNNVFYELNEGNHFYMANDRIIKCVKYFLSRI